jgi:hypothetical protein
MTVRRRPADRNSPRDPGRETRPAPPGGRSPLLTVRPAVILLIPGGGCHAGRPCAHAPCFQVRLEAPARPRPARRNATACASHLGEVVCDLTAWAHDHGLTRGQVTVLAIDRPPVTCPAAGSGGFGGFGEPAGPGFAFTTIPLTP